MSLEPISLLLLHQQGPASPAERIRQCSQTMAHWTRAGSEGDQLWCSASVRTFCVATAFFVAWSLASQVATASGEGSPAPLGSSTFAVPQYSHSPGHEIEEFLLQYKKDVQVNVLAFKRLSVRPPLREEWRREGAHLWKVVVAGHQLSKKTDRGCICQRSERTATNSSNGETDHV